MYTENGRLPEEPNGSSSWSPIVNTVIGTLVVDRPVVTFGTARRGLGELRSRPVPSSLYQMQQPTHQRTVYQPHIIRYGTIGSIGLIVGTRFGTVKTLHGNIAKSGRASRY